MGEAKRSTGFGWNPGFDPGSGDRSDIEGFFCRAKPDFCGNPLWISKKSGKALGKKTRWQAGRQDLDGTQTSKKPPDPKQVKRRLCCIAVPLFFLTHTGR